MEPAFLLADLEIGLYLVVVLLLLGSTAPWLRRVASVLVLVGLLHDAHETRVSQVPRCLG
jgi:hypothetical protein